MGITVEILNITILEVIHKGISSSKRISEGIWKKYCNFSFQRNSFKNGHRKMQRNLHETSRGIPNGIAQQVSIEVYEAISKAITDEIPLSVAEGKWKNNPMEAISIQIATSNYKDISELPPKVYAGEISERITKRINRGAKMLFLNGFSRSMPNNS